MKILAFCFHSQKTKTAEWFIKRFGNLQIQFHIQSRRKSGASQELTRWRWSHHKDNKWVCTRGEIRMWRSRSGWDRKLHKVRGFKKLKNLFPHWNSTLFARRPSAPILERSLNLSEFVQCWVVWTLFFSQLLLVVTYWIWAWLFFFLDRGFRCDLS